MTKNASPVRQSTVNLLAAWLVGGVVFIAAPFGRAADDDPSNEYRTDVDLQHPIMGNLTGDLDLGYRWNPDLEYQTYTILWPGLTYKATAWAQVSSGLRTFYKDSENSPDTLELRPYAGVKLFLPNDLKWNIYNNTRYEFRDTLNLTTHNWSGHSVVRSQFGVEVPLTSRERAWLPKTWYGRVDAEPFYRFDQEMVDQLRAEIALGHIVNDRLRVELVYTAQFTRTFSGSPWGFTENIISLNFKIGLKEGLLRRLLNPNQGD